MEKTNYKCDNCGKSFAVDSEGRLLFPKFVISAQGDSFIYCSSFCMKQGRNNIVTSVEIEQILKSLGKLPSEDNSYINQLIPMY